MNNESPISPNKTFNNNSETFQAVLKLIVGVELKVASPMIRVDKRVCRGRGRMVVWCVGGVVPSSSRIKKKEKTI